MRKAKNQQDLDLMGDGGRPGTLLDRKLFPRFLLGFSPMPIVNHIGVSIVFFETLLPKKNENPVKKSVLDAPRVCSSWY